MRARAVARQNTTSCRTMDRWAGRVAIVTGASSGIGAATARLLAQNGLRVVGVARRVDKIQELAIALKKENAKGELHAVECDVTKEDDIKKVVQWTKKQLGGVDVLVNNAGLNRFSKLSEQSTDDIRLIMETNVVSLTVFTREVIQDMKSRGVQDGHIFNINSLCGQCIPNHPYGYMYIASKHAVTVINEGLRRELRDMKTKIKVTSISPGLVRTEIRLAGGIPKEMDNKTSMENPILESEDVADTVLYALGTPPHVQVHEIIIRPVGEILA